MAETTSEVKSLNFTQSLKELIFIVDEKSVEGSMVVTVPNRLIGGPYTVWIDGFFQHVACQELGEQNSVITVNYSGGIHTIRIVGSTVIPEFTSISIMLPSRHQSYHYGLSLR